MYTLTDYILDKLPELYYGLEEYQKKSLVFLLQNEKWPEAEMYLKACLTPQSAQAEALAAVKAAGEVAINATLAAFPPSVPLDVHAPEWVDPLRVGYRLRGARESWSLHHWRLIRSRLRAGYCWRCGSVLLVGPVNLTCERCAFSAPNAWWARHRDIAAQGFELGSLPPAANGTGFTGLKFKGTPIAWEKILKDIVA